MAFLRQALDDPDAGPCGRCAVCVGDPLVPAEYPASLASRAAQFLRRTDEQIPPRRQWPSDALVEQRWHGAITPALRAEPGRSLSRWGDGGWGDLVKQGKQRDHRFDGTLVSGAADLVRDRWRPDPIPTWVTAVPSLAHPTLVPDFAARLAHALNLPFVPCVIKTRTTEPQKQMHNSYHQARNIAGAFHVEPWAGIAGPVLIVDDMVDSGWTFTIVAALLRAAGSGPVFPLALAKVVMRADG
jgi:ATP-dependent DNA helicase RecQ